jgi:UDP-2,3-diacylglucosamine hydrolase
VLKSALQAPTHWRTIDFISDLHLQPGMVPTFAAWQSFMQTSPADAVFILGDLFDVWVGDDVLIQPDADGQRFALECARTLRQAAARLSVFFIHGNRDFLLGAVFAQSSGMMLLNDPTTLEFAGERWLLSHGDALCLDDVDYMAFRSLVRSASWQTEFLQQPLAQRQAKAQALRAQSQQHQQAKATYAQVDADLAAQWLLKAQARTLIHGHTHQPGQHALQGDLQRIVLSDWDMSAPVPRAQVLRLCQEPGSGTAGFALKRLNLKTAVDH